MSEFKQIYLQPECCVKDQEVGRMWSQDAINDCEEGNEWIEYLLSSDVNQRIEELEAQNLEMQSRIDELCPTPSDEFQAVLDSIPEIK
jgi:hypothetical protein